ncbi:MAG: flagellar export chaperone FliS [Halanaerobium sp.]|nr:flagellar export chaperone FliS [Halanaerobium sp.]
MRSQNAYQQYKKVQVETANQGKLIILMYRGCLKFLRMARMGLEERNMELVNNALLRAQAIINELMVSLDMEEGGDVADNLSRLYEFMNFQLVQANIKKDPQAISIVEELAEELLEAWEEIINRPKKKRPKLSING